ncbi:response regulator receiver modulated diguanylate cyclase/phosphodiesterase [Halothece sp. PCC 7418]|uniref:two-component system response regulator n=1 Tax=Halothece sp. (strain PCC 7418) TaxID=65093 RepID=UPI0002A07EC4|nr:EAL domain-containing response regulator [Halothece sp. PCC 7418]AFZ43780.1 response regulator receiver modulated diguanylate cyclase/phosphodiesterase [Halothece sp. PCC 7418]
MDTHAEQVSSILIVDDDPDNYDVIENLLYAQDYQLYYAQEGKIALEQLREVKIDLILLDLMMPEMDGLELCQIIKRDRAYQGVPIIMVTALNTTVNLSQCLEAGADDFIGKPLNGTELRSRVRSMLRISDQYQKVRELKNNLEQQVEARSRQLQDLIWYHPLTGLASRFSLLQQLHGIFNAGEPFALLYFDCDEFQLVNSCYGYDLGDRALLAIRDRVSLCLGAKDIFAHFGEDDFCILVSDPKSQATVQTMIDQIFDAFSSPFFVSDQEIYLSISMGVVYQTPLWETDAEATLRNADTALNWAKREGKNHYQLFQPEMHQMTARKLQLARDLRQALMEDEFQVYYQPIIDLRQDCLHGFEALMRWQHPEEGLVAPGEFISCLEETSLIIPAGIMVLEKACQQLKIWENQGKTGLQISVNLSPLQFRNETLFQDIESVLQKTELSPSQLKLEITETLTVENPLQTVKIIEAFRSRGIQVSIDDFGTGYSSLSYLRQFPVNNLKIDRAFVNLLEEDRSNLQITRAIVDLGKALGMSITAEGIETKSQLEQLKQLGCELGQGYFFAKPMSVEAASDYLFQ